MLTFLLAFFTAAFILNRAFNLLDRVWPSNDDLVGKMEWLAKSADEYDTLFLGSSYVLSNIDVNVFDSQMAKNGCPTSSFSLSAGAIDPFDEFILLRMLRKAGRIHPKYVFVEFSHLGFAFIVKKANVFSERMRYLHTPQNTLDACFFDSGRGYSFKDLILYYGFRLKLCLANLTGSGHFAAILERVRVRTNSRDWKASKGYMPITNGTTDKFFLEQGEKGFKAALERMKENDAKNERILSASEELFIRRMVKEIRLMGAQPFIVVAPGTGKQHFRFEKMIFSGGPPTVPAFDFLEPDAYPEIYKFENFNDPNHLYPSAAAIFSKILADEFSGYLRKRTDGQG